MKQISNAMYIFVKLYSKRVIPAKQFAQELELSVRTVYRIIDELSLVLPIASKGGRFGGFYLPKDYKL